MLSGRKPYIKKLYWVTKYSPRWQAVLQICLLRKGANQRAVLLDEIVFSYFSRFYSLLGYEQVKKETSKYHNVFYEEKHVCNRGRARYQMDLARVKKYSVSEDFAAAVCILPEEYNQQAYFKFIEHWGTVSVKKSLSSQKDIIEEPALK